MEENSSTLFAGKGTSHAKTVKVYIKEPFNLTLQSLINPAITNKITLQSFQIGDKTDVSIQQFPTTIRLKSYNIVLS
ncbi:hypothetical protein, partial [Endozoicomonas sp. YOMI1]|uniref:hypothetical protein n=1 Tax=Endozoicomonas sp. YOMI1 TaxID=2828739 RepID=UPI0021481DB5